MISFLVIHILFIWVSYGFEKHLFRIGTSKGLVVNEW